MIMIMIRITQFRTIKSFVKKKERESAIKALRDQSGKSFLDYFDYMSLSEYINQSTDKKTYRGKIHIQYRCIFLFASYIMCITKAYTRHTNFKRSTRNK